MLLIHHGHNKALGIKDFLFSQKVFVHAYQEIKTIKQIHTTHNTQYLKNSLKYIIFLCIGSVGGVARILAPKASTNSDPPKIIYKLQRSQVFNNFLVLI